MDMEKLKESLMAVIKLATCPVCLEQLSPSVACCINGHAVCGSCVVELNNCPSCREPFIEVKHTSFNQILAALPRPCPHKGCSEISLGRASHERWCSHRQTFCRVCKWAGPFKDLYDHVKQMKHWESSTTPLRSFDNCCIDMDTNKNYWCIYSNQFFWRGILIKPSEKRLILEFICLPNDEAKDDQFKVNVKFQSDDAEYSAEVRLIPNYNLGTLENKMYFDTEMLKPFIVGDNNSLKYYLYVTKQ